MDGTLVNSFLKSATSVLANFGGDFQLTGKNVGNSPVAMADVLIVIGITGEFKGQFILNFKEDTALNIASAMMMGMPVSSLDEMASSAISELGNMIGGNAATMLYNAGKVIDITPPTILKGSNISLSTAGMEIISLQFLCASLGEMHVDVCVKPEK